MISVVCEQAAGRIKVMAGTGSNSTAEAIRLIKSARQAGADAALMVAPYYNKPTQDGFFEHYRAVAEAVDLPIVLYNIPGRTAKNREPETIARLGEIRVGDTVFTESGARSDTWVVISKRVIGAHDPALFRTSDETLTLTTCWPIRYFGTAPQRLLVTAKPVPDLASTALGP